MDPQIKKQLENGTKIAFERYRERHPNLAESLAKHRSEIMTSTVKSIENDPEVMAAIKSAEGESALQTIVQTALNYIPKAVGFV